MKASDLIGRSVYGMTIDELTFLQEHYENHKERHKHLERIDSIERAIKRLNEKKDDEPLWMAFAREDKETKRKWLASGARWHEWHSYTIWTYEGEEFYRWHSGAQVAEEIKNLRKADKLLTERMTGE